MRAATEAVFISRRFAIVRKISMIRWRSSDGKAVVMSAGGNYCSTQVQRFVAMIIS